MGRKKTVAVAGLDQAAGAMTENGRGKPGRKRGQKTLAVQEALDKGIQSPTEISDYVRQHHGLDVTPAHVSTIKGTLRRASGGKGGKGGRPKRTATLPQPTAAPPVRSEPARNGSGLTPQDLTELLRLADRLGGVERLEEYVAALKQSR